MSREGGAERNRFNHLVEMKTATFVYEPLREAITAELERDEQFRHLLVLSEHARRLVEVRESLIGPEDPIRETLTGYGADIDEELHRRADEIITELCASYVRQDERWIADDPDTVDTTEIQAAFDGIERALWWLGNHEQIVERLEITYPEDK